MPVQKPLPRPVTFSTAGSTALAPPDQPAQESTWSLQGLGLTADGELAPGIIRAGSLGVIGDAALAVAAIAVAEIARQAQGAVEHVSPAVAAQAPHRERLAPADQRVELDRDEIVSRGVFGDVQGRR